MEMKDLTATREGEEADYGTHVVHCNIYSSL